MQDKSGKELILGCVKGYTFEKIKPFVVTLKRTEYKGDLCLFVSDITKDTKVMLQRYGVKLIPYKLKHPFITKFPVSDVVLPKDLPNEISVKYLRYILYYLFLSKYGGNYSSVMLTDVKDVIFQRDPFDFNLDGGLYCFLEDNYLTIKTSPFNAGRILRHFGDEGLEKIGDNHPSCAGTVFGTVSDVINYLKKMIDLMTTIEAQGGGDQGLHNYLLYTGQLKNLKIIADNKGPVLTISSKLKKTIRFNKEGFVINADGDVVNTVHQYDRHPELFERFFRRYNLKIPMNFYLRYILRYKNLLENFLGWDFFNQLGWKLVNLLRWKIR